MVVEKFLCLRPHIWLALWNWNLINTLIIATVGLMFFEDQATGTSSSKAQP